MACIAVIPVKPLGSAKSRLAAVLGDQARTALVRDMLDRVHSAIGAASGVDGLMLAGLDRAGLSAELPLVSARCPGHNADLAVALDAANSSGARRLVVIAGDLALIEPRDVERLAAASDDTVAIAPDRHGTGTNALSLALPRAARFAFAFGPSSFARHCAQAVRLGLGIEVIRSRGLAHDIDEPVDLEDVRDLLGAIG